MANLDGPQMFYLLSNEIKRQERRRNQRSLGRDDYREVR